MEFASFNGLRTAPVEISLTKGEIAEREILTHPLKNMTREVRINLNGAYTSHIQK